MPNSPSVASTSLVSTSLEYVSEQPNIPSNDSGSSREPRSVSSPSGDGWLNALSHVACLRQGFAMQGFLETITNVFLQSWRDNTHISYSSAWKRWGG